jgi:cellulose synthase (UDP-forming)
MNFVAAGMRGVLWFGAAAMLCLAAIPMDSAAQGCAMSVLLGLLWYGRLPAEESSLWRVLTVVVGLFITFRYLVWRAIYTLDAHSASSAVVMYIVFGAEAYSSLLHWLGCTVNIAPMMREDLTLADLPPGTILPSIDVLIPSYNEDAALLEVTLRAALSMRYDPDRLRVVLCDDGGTDQKLADPNPAKAEAARSRRHEMQALCAKLGAVYITRERN